jgi:surfeit locus 1 family protein
MGIKKIIACLSVITASLLFAKLGFWQLDRLHWKQDMITSIERQQSINPQTVPLENDLDNPASHLKRGFLTGLWLTQKNVKIGPQIKDGAIGYWIITPFETNAHKIILINRGWVAETVAGKLLDNKPPQGPVKITGTLRYSNIKSDMVAGNPQSWRKFDAAGIAKTLKLQNISPVTLFMDGSNPPDHFELQPAPVLSDLRNNHKQYAAFWFTACVLTLAMFGFFNLPKKHSAS